jgi:uncharacterized protein YyaL (SSP411 family)
LYSEKFKQLQKKLSEYRSLRQHPLIDTKRIVAWNALLCTGWLDAYESFRKPEYLEWGLANLDFFLAACFQQSPIHQVDNTIPAMLDDIAYIIAACLQAFMITNEMKYKSQANHWIQYTLDHFFDADQNIFRYSNATEDLIVYTDDIYDNTMPSASGIMASNMIIAGRLNGNNAWEIMGTDLISQMEGSIVKYPESLSHWASLVLAKRIGSLEIKVRMDLDLKELYHFYLPKKIIHRVPDQDTGISLCHRFICEMPVDTIQKFQVLLDNHYHYRV